MIQLLLLLTIASSDPKVEILTVLNDFHDAAAKADRKRYFGHLSDEAVFLGTDGQERWDKQAFEALYGPYMDSGKGWFFVPLKQNLYLSKDGLVAWFDESLSSQTYGPCRGSGVLIKDGDTWKVAQYNLSIPIPNPLAKPFVTIIATQAGTP